MLVRILITVALLYCVAFASQASIAEEPFSGANNFSVIVTGNANFGSGVHIHGGLYVGGDLTYSGSNTSTGSDLASGSTGLVVEGSVTTSSTLDLMNTSYYVGGSNSATLQNAGSELTANPELSADTIQTALDETSAELAGLADTAGTTLDDTDFNQIMFYLVADELNVITLDETWFLSMNSTLLFENFTEDTYVVINVDLSSDLDFYAKVAGLSEYAYSNIIWNFVGEGTLNVYGDTFKGTILASQATVNWYANDIDGQLITSTLNWLSTSQSHYYTPWSPKTTTSVPTPAMAWLFILGLLAILMIRSHPRQGLIVGQH